VGWHSSDVSLRDMYPARGGTYVDVESAKVLPKLLLFLSPDPGSELGDEDVWIVGCKKVRLCFVCESAFVNDLERLGGGKKVTLS
jgi:hypothetical protein